MLSRRTIHNWIARYEAGGLASLTDRSRRPNSRHQTDAPWWGRDRPVSGRSSIYRCLKRHGLIELRRRRT